MGGLKTLDNNTLKSLGQYNKSSSSSGGATSNATLAAQLAQTALLAQILAEVDYEHSITYGRDTQTATLIDIATQNIVEYGVPGIQPFTTASPAANITITNNDNNYYVEIGFDPIPTATTVNLEINYSILSCDPGAGQITLSYYGDGNLVNTSIITTTGSSGDSGTDIFVYDNSGTNYTTFTVQIFQSDTSGTITVIYDNVITLVDNISSDFVTNVIKKVDKYNDGVLVNTRYFDYVDVAYSLRGTFVPDARLESTYLESLITTEIQKLTSKNTPTHVKLITADLPYSVTGFKEVSFVCDGTIDVEVDGNIITYPFTLGTSTILGSTLKADVASVNAVTFDGTGTVLLTVQY
jgi:hypothetical protein